MKIERVYRPYLTALEAASAESIEPAAVWREQLWGQGGLAPAIAVTLYRLVSLEAAHSSSQGGT
jgi:hypothetical protein